MRAGCTEKFRDVATLCEMLTYQSGPVRDYVRAICHIRVEKHTIDSSQMVQPTAESGSEHEVLYNSPAEEFKVSVVTVCGFSFMISRDHQHV